MRYEYAHSAPIRTGDGIDAFDRIDAHVRDLAISVGAREMQYPALIARDVLEQAEYPRAFPHLLLSASRLDLPDDGESGRVPAGAGDSAPPGGLPDSAATAWCLSPAVCYHAYAHFARCVLDAPEVITARGRCFRAEREQTPGVRQTEFEMREIVLLGTPAWIDALAETVRLAIESYARELGMAGDWEAAEDPFFLPAHAGKALMQRVLKAKLEYQYPAAGGLALASINRHGTFFGRRFGIETSDGVPVHSMCVAVGLDRWAHHAHRAPLPDAAGRAVRCGLHNEQVTS